MLTKRRLAELRENALRDDVLVPLLEAMKHQGVRVHHGGTEEQGKDIISWKPDDLGGRRNFALVVKAVPINGQANSRTGSAGEVLMQIQQCFGEGFRDPVTRKEYEVHECWVVTNKTISNSAHRSLESALRSAKLERHVKLIDGDMLWRLIEEHMPAARGLEKLGEAKQALDDINPHYRPTVNMTGSGIVLGVEPKFSSASEDKPFEFKASVTIPATPEHETLIQAMQQHVATGSPVEIPGKFVQMTLPEGFDQLVGTDIGSLRIGSPQNRLPLLARIEFESDEGNCCALEYVHLMVAQAGTDEVTLTNCEQPIPVHLTLIVPQKGTRAKIQFEFAPLPLNVHELAHNLRIQSIIGKSCAIKVISLKTGLPVFLFDLSRGLTDPPDPEAVEVIKDLDAIQAKIQRPITFPDRDITEQEGQTITKLHAILHDGEVRDTVFTGVRMTVSIDNAQEQLDFFEQEGVKLLRQTEDDSVDLFETTIPLGPVVPTFRGLVLSNGASIAAKLADSLGEQDFVELEFLPTSDSTLLQQYPDWGATVPEWESGSEATS